MIQEAVRLFTFETDDPDDVAHHLTTLPPSMTIQKLGCSPFGMRAQVARLPRLSLFKVDMSSARVLVPEPLDYGAVTIPLGGAFETVTRGQTDSFEPVDAHVALEDDTVDLRTDNGSTLLVASFAKPLLQEYVRKFYAGNAPKADRFGPRLSFDTPGGASFWRFLNSVWTECTRGSVASWPTLVIKKMEETLITMLIHALDDQLSDSIPGAECGTPIYLKRAEEYILAHLDAPISLPDLAEVARVSGRTLSKAFRQRHGQGPAGFLKARRLEAVQRALLAANPDSTTVTEVAMDFGFCHLGYFSKDYRQAFQELPSETLRR